MPYVYIHLVSFCQGIYVCVYSIFQGLNFLPGSTYTYGLCFPILNIFVISTATVGLLEVGHSLANPLGAEAEDFAVLTFLRDAVANSRLVMEGIEREPTRRAETWAPPSPKAQAIAPSASPEQPAAPPVPTAVPVPEGSSNTDRRAGARVRKPRAPLPEGVPPPEHPRPSPPDSPDAVSVLSKDQQEDQQTHRV